MKNIMLSLIVVGMLTACGTNQSKKTSFPDLPTKLMVAPGELQTIQPDSITAISIDDKSASDEKLSELLKTITANYTLANRIREQLIDIQLWIQTQKSLNP